MVMANKSETTYMCLITRWLELQHITNQQQGSACSQHNMLWWSGIVCTLRKRELQLQGATTGLLWLHCFLDEFIEDIIKGSGRSPHFVCNTSSMSCKMVTKRLKRFRPGQVILRKEILETIMDVTQEKRKPSHTAGTRKRTQGRLCFIMYFFKGMISACISFMYL